MDDTKAAVNGMATAGRDGHGFWVPDAVVDVHLPVVGASALAVYFVVCRYATLADYPSAGRMARMLSWSTDKVRNALAALHVRGLLNDHDMAAIRGSRRKKDNDDLRDCDDDDPGADGATALGDGEEAQAVEAREAAQVDAPAAAAADHATDVG